MKSTRLPSFAFFLSASLVFMCATFAADWTQYRGPNGDGKSIESGDQLTWGDNGPKVVWKAETPLGFSSFSVADARAFTIIAVDGKEHCVALEASTGKELWRTELGTTEYGHDGGNSGAQGNRGGDGPRSTPVTDGSRVYVYDSHLVLSCLNATNGDVVWSRDIVKEFAGRNIKWLNATSPLLADNRVFVAGGGAGQTFLAFEKNSGEVVWKTGDDMITHATPSLGSVAGKRQIVFFMQSGLVSLDPTTGQENWKTEFPFSVSTAASPVLAGDHVYCSAGYGVGAGLFQLTKADDVEEVWFKSNELMNHWSSPLVHDGHLYGIFEFKKYGRAPLQCVELATGEIKWSQRGFGPGNCILVGDRLVVLSDAGEVAIVSANPNEYQEIARAKVLDGKCWSTPAYSDGKIFVRSTQQAACIDVGK